ncbi:MAG: hypothetical protein HRU00_17010 [Myxococcales bacterium]|nr:hypothetical protein [Myxococcales bacterium]
MMHFDAGALNVSIQQLQKIGSLEQKAAEAAVQVAGRLLESRIRKNMSLRDHSPEQLARLGHPYARRHGSIGIHAAASNKTLLNPEMRVHTQKGTLLNALRTNFSRSPPNFAIKLDAGIAPHAVYVVKGTRVMLGRDILWNTAAAPATQKATMRVIVKELGSRLRSKAALRFTPRGPGSGLNI